MNAILTRLSKLELRRAVSFVWESGPAWTIASGVLLVIQGVLPLVTLYLTKLVLDAVTAGLVATDKSAAFNQVVLMIAALGTATLFSALVRLISSFVSEAQAQLVTDHMYGVLHSKSIEVDLEYYENSTYYDTLHRAQEEAPYRPNRIVTGLLRIGQNSVSLLAMTGLLLSLHWSIALVLFIASIPGVIARLRYADRLHKWQRDRTPLSRKSWYFNWMLTGDEHAKENRLFNLGQLFLHRASDLRAQLRKERLMMSLRYYLVELGTQIGGIIAIFLAYAFIAYRAVHGQVTLGDLVMYYQAFQRGQGFLRDLLSGFAALYEDSLFLSNLYEFLDLKPKITEPAHPKPMPQPLVRGIVFENVDFNYPNSSREVLKDINLTIGPGEVIALVGANGSGKTTLIKLLCRLYDPTSGSITVDGTNLSSFLTTDLRREISVIFQDYAHYHLTARDNIWFGNIELPSNGDAVVAAARYSGADDVISGLKLGYDTILGKWFENGEELSVGEWQKVALARAFLRKSQLIVLDEPTSSMDAKAEHEVFTRFRELVKGRSAIIISHRLSSVKMADRIYVLDKGRIVECGHHDDLVAQTGLYSRMFETQAQHYR